MASEWPQVSTALRLAAEGATLYKPMNDLRLTPPNVNVNWEDEHYKQMFEQNTGAGIKFDF